MVSKQILEDLKKGSAIRAMFVEGKALAERMGAENVYDFSLGNPCTPVPEAYTKAMLDIIREEDSLSIHGYMDNAGYPQVRKLVADSLNQRFGTDFDEGNILMTAGAAGGINVILRTLLEPEEEVMVFVPYFTEYRNYCQNWRGKLVEVNPDYDTFLPDFTDMERKLSPKTKAVLINNPVNPSGVVYTEEVIKKIAALLEKKQKEYGHEIYLISDEPYRELVFDGKSVPFLTHYYKNTLVAYSFSKSLSIPGDRIGYIVVPKEMADYETVFAGLSIANRIIGFVNAPALMQKTVARCLYERTDVEFYDQNRKLIYGELLKLGFTCVKPEGTFYLFVKSPVPNEKQFVEAAKKHHILLVGGSTFACPGYVRLAYCVPYETIERSLKAFAALAEEFGLGEHRAQ